MTIWYMVDMHRLHYFKNERLLNDRTDAQTGREIVLRAAVGSREQGVSAMLRTYAVSTSQRRRHVS
jgi:hypothetical protein